MTDKHNGTPVRYECDCGRTVATAFPFHLAPEDVWIRCAGCGSIHPIDDSHVKSNEIIGAA